MITARTLARPIAVAAAALAFATGAEAAQVQVKVTVENLAPANSVRFAPLRVGFNNGTFDSFSIGDVATAPIISIAEGGTGSAWFPAFAAADPTATLGTAAGALLPGESDSSTFMVDTAVNQYFTFASMVVPSNDFFVGNDSPTQYHLFDSSGNLLIGSITQRSRDLWDAGSEIFDPAAAAFVGNNDLRADQNSVVAFNFAEFAAYNGMTTAAGYTFDSQLSANTDIYRISFEVAPVPEPGTYALMGLGLAVVGWAGRRATRRT
ncbi:MAG: PEP-CTERM sorting domain-containing protein [Betaproteobacteria bacterium]|nr:PEP-CTERM sorting domain-containing protein [Betaproteobacteria bacterium]